MGTFVNPFISVLVPGAWSAQCAVFGRPVEYWIGGDSAQVRNIVVIWVEGTEDEDSSPGRYSHVRLQHTDIDGPPVKGDAIYRADTGITYEVVRIAAYAIGFSTVVLQAQGEET